MLMRRLGDTGGSRTRLVLPSVLRDASPRDSTLFFDRSKQGILGSTARRYFYAQTALDSDAVGTELNGFNGCPSDSEGLRKLGRRECVLVSYSR